MDASSASVSPSVVVPKVVPKVATDKTVLKASSFRRPDPSKRIVYYYCGDLHFCTREGPLKRHITMAELVAAYRSRGKKSRGKK